MRGEAGSWGSFGEVGQCRTVGVLKDIASVRIISVRAMYSTLLYGGCEYIVLTTEG